MSHNQQDIIPNVWPMVKNLMNFLSKVKFQFSSFITQILYSSYAYNAIITAAAIANISIQYSIKHIY